MCLLIFEKFEIWVGGVIFKNLTSLNEILKDITICKNQSLKIYDIYILIEDSLSLLGISVFCWVENIVFSLE